MSLNGNLSFVPIDEVLRLLTRSKQQGSVEVTGDGIYGRVFIGEKGVDLATTSDDENLHRHLVNSGFSDESSLRRITTGETTLAALADSNRSMIELLREMTVESLYQIAARGDEFEVREGTTTPYASPNSFELEKLIADARGREKDWAKVSEVIPDLTGAIQFRRDLGDREEVTVKTDDWKILSEIGPGASVSEIADNLGTTDFWAASVTSRLVKNELVDIETSIYATEVETTPSDDLEQPTIETEQTEEASETEDAGSQIEAEAATEQIEAVVSDTHDEAPVFDEFEEVDEVEEVDADVETEPASEPVSVADTDPNESWWQEPQDETNPTGDGEPVEPAVVAEGLSEMPTVSNDDGSDVEEDTEAFLEKVFSELEGSPEPEGEEGHGLLRRRRMGTLRDFSSDS